MALDSDKAILITIGPKVCSYVAPQETSVGNENIIRSKEALKPGQNVKEEAKPATVRISQAAEERQRTGRYLAIGIALIMLFIAFYHALLRHASVLAGLLAPAIIMLVYILWLLYFAKKRQPQVSNV